MNTVSRPGKIPHCNPEPRQPLESRQSLQRLRSLVERLEQGAQIARNGCNTADGERAALQLSKEAAALRWALLQLDPITEGPRQLLRQLVP